MIWFVMMQILSTLLDWVRLGNQLPQEKDLEILLLRHQLAILERKHTAIVRPSRGEKLILSVLATRLRTQTDEPSKNCRRSFELCNRRQ